MTKQWLSDVKGIQRDIYDGHILWSKYQFVPKIILVGGERLGLQEHRRGGTRLCGPGTAMEVLKFTNNYPTWSTFTVYS